MFNRNQVPSLLATRTAFAARVPAQPQAARDVPAYVAAEWTGSQERPQGAAERLRALLD